MNQHKEEIDLKDDLSREAMENLGFLPEDLIRKTKEEIIKETKIPEEFESEREFFLNEKMKL